MTQVGAFADAQVGQCLDVDQFAGCQCVDLADAWAALLGKPLPLVAAAKDFVGAHPPGWMWIPNTPEAVPAPGDLPVWDARIGAAGHIDLRVDGTADTLSFPGLDQNWLNSNPDHGSPAAFVRHNYYGVAGWLRPISGGAPMPQTPFFVTINPGAHWRAAPDGQDMGPAPSILLKIVEVANDGASDWYRSDLGLWWLVNTDTTPSAPPPAPAPGPADPLEARVARLERILGGVESVLAQS